ncbi:MAG: hypothetical protein GY715_15305 [Planctomycetes bacterium]|nr:hypothetical protein [Planctomycetota bacterium]
MSRYALVRGHVAAGIVAVVACGLLAARSLAPPPCFLDPPCDGSAEGEPCSDSVNGGCDVFPPSFGDIEIDGDAVCGTNWAHDADRDEDWYLFNVSEARTIHVHLRAETSSVALIYGLFPITHCPTTGQPPGTHAYSGNCDADHVVGEYTLEPGAHAVVVLTGNESGEAILDGFPCPDGTETNNAYELRLTSPVCQLDPPCEGVDEGEPCNEFVPDSVNGGCTVEPNLFGAVTVNGPAICGTNWAYSGVRDTDWFRFQLVGTKEISIDLRAEVSTIAIIAALGDGGTCPPVLSEGTMAFADLCDEAVSVTGSYVLPAGWYVLFVGTALDPDGTPRYDGLPCPPPGWPTHNAYEVRLTAPCAEDLGGNGVVDFADILMVIGGWGPCGVSCPVDLDGSGDVGFGDILAVIGAWGPC